VKILSQAGIEDCVRNGIADFVRVALANGLGRKDKVFAHANLAQVHINVSRYDDVSLEGFGVNRYFEKVLGPRRGDSTTDGR
jgi:hypothetical protein